MGPCAARVLVCAAAAFSALLLGEELLTSSPTVAAAAAAAVEDTAETEDAAQPGEGGPQPPEEAPHDWSDISEPGPVDVPDIDHPLEGEEANGASGEHGGSVPEQPQPPSSGQEQPPPQEAQREQPEQRQGGVPFPELPEEQTFHHQEELEGLQHQEPRQEQHAEQQEAPTTDRQQQNPPPSQEPQDSQQQQPNERERPPQEQLQPTPLASLPSSASSEQQQSGNQQHGPDNSAAAEQQRQQQQPTLQDAAMPDPRQGRCSIEELEALTRHFADGTACPAFGCIDKESSNYLALIEEHYGDKYSPAEASAFAGVLAACHCRCPVMRCEVEYVNANGSKDCKEATREFCLQSNHRFSEKCAMVAKQLPKVYDIEADPHAFKSPCQVCEPDLPEAAADAISAAAAEMQQSGGVTPSVGSLTATTCAAVAAAVLLQ